MIFKSYLLFAQRLLLRQEVWGVMTKGSLEFCSGNFSLAKACGGCSFTKGLPAKLK